MNLDTSEIFLADGWVECSLPDGWTQFRDVYTDVPLGMHTDVLDFCTIPEKRIYRIIHILRDIQMGPSGLEVNSGPLEIAYCTENALNLIIATRNTLSSSRSSNQSRHTKIRTPTGVDLGSAILRTSEQTDLPRGSMIASNVSELRISPDVARFATQNAVPLASLLPQSKIK